MTDPYLAKALAGPHLVEYQTNVHFRSTIDHIAVLLPLWIDAIAMATASQQSDMEAMIAALEQRAAPWPIPRSSDV